MSSIVVAPETTSRPRKTRDIVVVSLDVVEEKFVAT
jgi:hypothetical protein